MQALIRPALLALALVVCGVIIASHGARGIAAIVLIALAATVPRTRVWKMAESGLVRLTGSRRRAAVLVMSVVIVGALVVNVVQYFR